MRVDFAPMEGVTGAVYRRLHHACFSGVDRYYIPFLAPSADFHFTGKVLTRLDAAHLAEVPAVPQLLTRNAADFNRAAQKLAELGFCEVNLNLGCPSGTVVSKGKGAGFLADPEALDAFLEEIFRAPPLPISVKTRLGVERAEEFPRLLEIYNRYPLRELIVHPRTRSEFYRGGVHMDLFDYAARHSRNRLCYNGDLVTAEDCRRMEAAYPELSGLMIGRGLAADPALGEKLLGGSMERDRLRRFHDGLCQSMAEAYGSWSAVLPRMKEQWFYLLHSFDDTEKAAKKLRKATKWPVFYDVTREIFETLPLRQDARGFSQNGGKL